MNYPFKVSPECLSRVQSVISKCDTPIPIHKRYEYSKPDVQTQPRKFTSHQEARDFRSLSYSLLQEALRKQRPGQAQLNANNRLMDFELHSIVQEQKQSIDVFSITAYNNVAAKLTFVDISVEEPIHKEPDGSRHHLHISEVAERRIPYDVQIYVDIHITQEVYEPVPPLRDYISPKRQKGKAFFAPCLIVRDVWKFNNWGLATDRITSQNAETRLGNSLKLWFQPGVWDEFHQDACRRQNKRSRTRVTVDQFKKQLWNPLNEHDQKLWNCACEESQAPGLGCIKLLVFIGHYDTKLGCFIVQKMGKRTLFDSYGEVLATLPPYIEQCPELHIKSTTEYIHGIPFIDLPCMIGSKYCHTTRNGDPIRVDSGIISTGSCDKAVILLQQLCNNKVFLFNQKANQMIGEVRSAHIHKRRSTSAFRLILSPKDGPYILLPFLQKATGADVRVHLVDFIRLMWEYGGVQDPDLNIPIEIVPMLSDLFLPKHHSIGYFNTERIMWHAAPKQIRLWLKQCLPNSSNLVNRIMLLTQCETWQQYLNREQQKRDRRKEKQESRRRKKQAAYDKTHPKRGRKKKVLIPKPKSNSKHSKSNPKSNPKHNSHGNPTTTNQTEYAKRRAIRIFKNIFRHLGRRTIQSIDDVVSVLTGAFFYPQISSNPSLGPEIERYFEIKAYIREHTHPSRFRKSVGSILNFLAQEGARERSLAAQRQYVLNNVLRNELFPHLGMGSDPKTRRAKLFYMVHQVFRPLYDLFTGRSQLPSDKDSLGNKRIDLYDETIGTCFRQQAQSNRGTLANFIQAEADSGIHIDSALLYSIISNKRFETSIRYCFNTGRTRPSDKRPGGKTQTQNGSGTIQQVSGNAISRISHTRHVKHAHLNADNKTIGPRQVHLKDPGSLCPGETPEGQQCGIIKNLALLVHVSIGYVTTPEMCALVHCIIPPQFICEVEDNAIPWDGRFTIIINGVISAFYFPSMQQEIVDMLKLARRYGNIHFETSIYIEHTSIMIDTRAGRTQSPCVLTDSILDGRFLQVVMQNQHWESRNLITALMQCGCIDYLCTNEEADKWIAPTWSDWLAQLQAPQMYTHILFHAVTMLDYAIGSMIFPEANQGPRNTYQAKMSSQAVTLPDAISETSTAKNKYHLNYGQAPLVQSMVGCSEGLTKFTSGLNCITALLRWTYNVEDPIIVNQGAVDRGLFHMTYTYDLILEPENNQIIEVPNPRFCNNVKQANYSKLDPITGIVPVGTCLKYNDVLAGMTSTILDPRCGKKIKHDVSMLYLKKIPARVSRITPTTNRYGNKMYNITVVATNKVLPFPKELFGTKMTEHSVQGSIPRMISTRPSGIGVPQVGDKFASRSAQKGVIGLLVPEGDLPFVAEGPNIGMRPEIIMSPDALPSRMTIGSPLLEMMLGLLGAVLGKQIDGTPFSTEHLDIDEVRKELEKAGQDSLAECTMRCGLTGEIITKDTGGLGTTFGGAEPMKITMGPVYYQRLAHFVVAKIHSRNGGPLNYLTRQPTQGRAKNGGGRFGTMETDTLVAHGGAACIRERLLLASDNYRVPICRLCRRMGQTHAGLPPYCHNCNIPNTCEIVELPYAAKIMMHLYQCANLTFHMGLKKSIGSS